jgi:electron transfer flavoprotein-quinone oxidoreductase
MCLAAGIWLEGVNFAIGSGAAAGRTAVAAIGRGDTSAAGLAGYRTRLESSFVLADHRKLRRAPHLVMGDLAQRQLPALACSVVEDLFTVRNPDPKPGLARIVRTGMRRHGIKVRDAASQAWQALRTFG